MRPAAPIERIRALAGLDLEEFGSEHEAFGLGKPGDRCALGLDAEPRAALASGGDAIVGESLRALSDEAPLFS